MNNRKIIEHVWDKTLTELTDGTSAWAQPLSAENVESINNFTKTRHGKIRCLNIGTLTPFDISTLTFLDILFYAPDGVEKGGVYPCLSVGPYLTWNWENAQPVEEESEDFSYELRAEAYATGGITGLNEHQGLMEVEEESEW